MAMLKMQYFFLFSNLHFTKRYTNRFWSAKWQHVFKSHSKNLRDLTCRHRGVGAWDKWVLHCLWAVANCCLHSFGRGIAAWSHSSFSLVKFLFTWSMASTEMLKYRCSLVLVLFYVFTIQQRLIQKTAEYGKQISNFVPTFHQLTLPPENTSGSTGVNKNTLVSCCGWIVLLWLYLGSKESCYFHHWFHINQDCVPGPVYCLLVFTNILQFSVLNEWLEMK